MRISQLLLLVFMASLAPGAFSQEMEARAYSPSPVGASVIVFVYTHQSGDVLLDPALPLKDVSTSINGTAFGYGRTFALAGRQANVSAALPYVWARVKGTVFEQQQEVTRSGLGDIRARLTINLMGSPALNPREFAARKPTTLLGASLTVAAPTGQYDPRRLVNLGANRWAFKPEIGLSQPLGRWTLEAIGGAWFFTENKNFFGGSRREQRPLVSVQGHVIYTLRPRMWVAFGATYFTGGRTTVDGVLNADLQKTSRIGATYSFPVTKRHSLKVAWSKGVTTLVGGDINAVTVGYQYVWFK
ncbi:MAG TPA: transporter [Blastocatellia bacterium]|nr:transporter [Blastocatellia bacterium]